MIYAVVAGLVALAVNVAISHIAPYRSRPFALEPHLVHQLVQHPRDTSFPSDHTAASFGFAMGLLYAGALDGVLSLLLAAGVAWGRVFVGLHWPTDVAVGAMIGVAAGIGVLGARRHMDWLVRIVYAVLRVPKTQWKSQLTE